MDEILNANEVVGTPVKIKRYVNADRSVVQRMPAEGLTQVTLVQTTYRDGRVIQQEVGEDGQPGEQVGPVSYNDDLRTEWNKANTLPAKTQTYEDPGHPGQFVTTITYATGRTQTRPASRQEIESSTGQAPAPGRTPEGAEAERIKVQQEQALEDERKWNQANGGLYETHAQRAERERKAREDAQNADLAAQRKKTRTYTSPTGQTQTFDGLTDAEWSLKEAELRQRDKPPLEAEKNVNGRRMGYDPATGQYSKDLGPVPLTPSEQLARQQANRPNVLGVPEGQRVISVSPDGKVTELPGPPPSPGLAGIDLKAAQTNVFNRIQRLRDLAADLRRRMTSDNPAERITAVEAEKLYNQVKAQEDSAQQADLATINAQASVHSSNIQWAQTQQQTANTRLTNAADLYKNALANRNALLLKVGPGAGSAIANIAARDLEDAHKYATMFGGLTDVSQPTLPPALAAIYGASLPNTSVAAPNASIGAQVNAGPVAPIFAPGGLPPISVEAGGQSLIDPERARAGLQAVADDPFYDNAIIPQLAAEIGVG